MLMDEVSLGDLAREMAALRREVRELRDREEIRELVYRYGISADVERYDEFLDTLTEDVVWTAAGTFNPGMAMPGEATMHGHAEALAAVSGPGHAGIANKEQHVMANLVIEVDGDHAQAIGHLVLTLHNWGGFSIGTCRYVHMNFRREQDRWRISQLTFRETGDAASAKYIAESQLLKAR